jgi:hypothetical protein
MAQDFMRQFVGKLDVGFGTGSYLRKIMVTEAGETDRKRFRCGNELACTPFCASYNRISDRLQKDYHRRGFFHVSSLHFRYDTCQKSLLSRFRL